MFDPVASALAGTAVRRFHYPPAAVRRARRARPRFRLGLHRRPRRPALALAAQQC
jgi:hypothetical protein